jgi:hypothetical protein
VLDAFELTSYKNVASRVADRNEAYPEPWPEYAGAWSGLWFRFYACSEHNQSFTKSIQIYGGIWRCAP